VQRSQIVLQLRMASITPEGSEVASRYNSRLPLSIVTIGTRIGSLSREEVIGANSIILLRRTGVNEILSPNERVWDWITAHTMAYEEDY
jgi:hypothetical protein